MRLRIALTMGLFAPLLAAAQGLPEQPSHIGYASPAAALHALQAKPGVVVTEKDDWIILDDTSENALWTIAKPGNPAYPAAVKRYVANGEVVMKVICGASKQACDNLVTQFQELNKRAIDAAQ
jgi:hypothetical protein